MNGSVSKTRTTLVGEIKGAVRPLFVLQQRGIEQNEAQWQQWRPTSPKASYTSADEKMLLARSGSDVSESLFEKTKLDPRETKLKADNSVPEPSINGK